MGIILSLSKYLTPSAAVRHIRLNIITKNMIDFFKKEKEPENLEEILKSFQELREEFSTISDQLKVLEKKIEASVQKVGIVRFNPFKEAGGDQSFSIAFLDENDTGVVITSLYGRQDNKVFAKPVKNGKSKYLLSEEERQAIEEGRKEEPENLVKENEE